MASTKCDKNGSVLNPRVVDKTGDPKYIPEMEKPFVEKILCV
jgi:hypothetical protein